MNQPAVINIDNNEEDFGYSVLSNIWNGSEGDKGDRVASVSCNEHCWENLAEDVGNLLGDGHTCRVISSDLTSFQICYSYKAPYSFRNQFVVYCNHNSFSAGGRKTGHR